jgi:hypothetical protein
VSRRSCASRPDSSPPRAPEGRCAPLWSLWIITRKSIETPVPVLSSAPAEWHRRHSVTLRRRATVGLQVGSGHWLQFSCATTARSSATVEPPNWKLRTRRLATSLNDWPLTV